MGSGVFPVRIVFANKHCCRRDPELLTPPILNNRAEFMTLPVVVASLVDLDLQARHARCNPHGGLPSSVRVRNDGGRRGL